MAKQGDNHPKYQGRPVFGYDVAEMQDLHAVRKSEGIADFFLPHLNPGMTLLDCGCGPGTITQGLAKVVAPAQVIGCDLEPGMVEKANSLVREQGVNNLTFQVGNILELPFPDNSFDAVFSCAVTEHLNDPVKGIRELYRVLNSGGVLGIIRTDWEKPLISPPSSALEMFFEIFEKGFQFQGGSMNMGRHLRSMAHEAGFTVLDFFASYNNAAMPEAVHNVVYGHIERVKKLPLFDQAIELGWTDRPALEKMTAEMGEWAKHPDAFLAIAACKLVARKE